MSDEKCNPWTVVNVVFTHLAEQGLHPVLGEAGDPSAPAGELLRALGIEPGQPVQQDEQVKEELAELRARFEPAVNGEGDSGRRPSPG